MHSAHTRKIPSSNLGPGTMGASPNGMAPLRLRGIVGVRFPVRPPHGSVAQSVERRTENPCVTGSIPVGATTWGISSNWENIRFASESYGFESRILHHLGLAGWSAADVPRGSTPRSSTIIFHPEVAQLVEHSVEARGLELVRPQPSGRRIISPYGSVKVIGKPISLRN